VSSTRKQELPAWKTLTKLPEEVLQSGATEGGDIFQSGYSLIGENSVFVPIPLTTV